MGKSEPLTWREKFLAKRIGISDSVYVNTWSDKLLNGHHSRWDARKRQRLPGEYRAILKRRANHPSYADHEKMLETFKKGFKNIDELKRFYWKVNYADRYQAYLVRRFVEAEDEIAGLSEEEIARKMLLEGGEK